MKAPAEPARFATRSEAARLSTPVRHEVARTLGDPLDAALALAAAGHGMTFVAFRAPLVAPSAFVRVWPDAPLVAWSSPSSGTTPALTIAGIGVARELRGTGAARFTQVIEAARAITIEGAVICPQRTPPRHVAAHGSVIFDFQGIDDGDTDVAGRLLPASSLGVARPRFLGGAAFAAGAADRGPWAGFGDAWFVLPRWTYTSDGQAAWLVLAVDHNEARDGARWRSELVRNEQALAPGPEIGPVPTAVEISRGSTELWRAQVQAITAAIGNGECSKIVAARTCSLTLVSADPAPSAQDGVGLRAAGLLDALDARHGECVRLLVRPLNAGALIAATPERLVRRDGAVIRCDALAGTIRHATNDELERTDAEREAAAALLASAKDRREHQLVVSAIRQALEELGAKVEAPAEPQIRTLRHVLHLHTPFRATTSTPRHVLELVEKLHPTPAVGGTPTAFAIDWIREHEPVPRGWYASPVGWFDLDGDGELAVAIRSGVVHRDRVHLWAGAGIVAGSDPDRELAETELKLRAMLGALGVG